MIFKINNLSLNLAIATLIFIASFPIFSMTNDIKLPIYIKSDTQSFDIINNVITFNGNVIISQGTMKINADKVIVTSFVGKQSKEIIDGYGSPTIFYKMLNNGNPIKGHASHMHYELGRDLVIFTGHAYLEQFDSKIIGDRIIFLLKERKMLAYSEKDKCVTTIIIPSK